MIPAAVFLGAVTGGLLWSLFGKLGRSKNETVTGLRVSGDPISSPAFTSQTFFDGQLKRGQLYRLWVRIEPEMQRLIAGTPRSVKMTNEAFLVQTMSPITVRLGFDSPILVIHDPTDISVWCLLARWSSSVPYVLSARYITPLKIEAVQEPPSSARSTASRHGAKTTILDEGLTEDEVWAVTHALAEDDDTKHLGGFASTFDPDYPIAAGLLRVKSMLAAIRSYHSPGRPTIEEAAGSSTPLIGVLRKAGGGLGKSVDESWGRYAGLPLDEKEKTALGKTVKSLGAAHVRRSKGETPAPVLITPAALQLAFSTRRPQLSLVSNPAGITDKLRAISNAAKAGSEDALEAQRKLDAANRYLERLQWVAWYKRQAILSTEEGPLPGSLTGVLTVGGGRRDARGA